MRRAARFLLTFSRWDPLSLIDARGDLDRSAAHVLRVGGETELENSLFLVVDLSRVTAIDDHGLGALSALDRIATLRGGWTRVHDPAPAVLHALEDFDLTDMLLTSPNEAASANVAELVGAEEFHRHVQRGRTRAALRSTGRGCPEWGPA